MGAALWGAGRRRERNMAFAREEARGRIETDPACAREVNFRPGVQIGEIVIRARRPVEGFHIRLQLNEIAGHEARREPVMPQDVHEQPARVPARA